MEPNLVRKDINYQKKILVIISVLVISLFMGGSFALLSSSSEVKEAVTFKTGELNMKVTTTGTLSLEGEVPKSYEDGFKSNDITLTLTNTGTLEIGKYEIKLEGDSTTTLENKYIRYSISEDEGKTYLAAKLLNDDNIIYTGYNLKTSKVLKLKIWIDEEAGSNALNKIYNGKINVELYQNRDSDTVVQVVKSKLVSNYSGRNENFFGGLVGVNLDGDLYHEVNSKEIREYRYSGPNVNNYVIFNNELWRIIGVFKDESEIEHVKIVRNEQLSGIFSETYTINGVTYYIKNKANNNQACWDCRVSGDRSNDWATAGLQYWLNTEKDDTTNFGYLSKIMETSKNMIQNTNYYLGAITRDGKIIEEEGIGTISDTAIEAYNYERAVDGCIDGKGLAENTSSNEVIKNSSCRVFSNQAAVWNGKVALLYPSDYGYSASNKYWKTQLFYKPYNETPVNGSWLVANKSNFNTFLLSPSSVGNSAVVVLHLGSYLRSNGVNGYTFIFPTLYLKSNVKITSGDGTSTNPYKLTLE